MKKEKRLVICSYGLEPKHITLETLAVLKKCGAVFSDSLEGGTGDFIAQSCAEFENLRGLSAPGITARLKEAFAGHDTVGFLTYGNPGFLNATTVLIKAGMAAARVKVSVLPAVSSFDSIVNLLDLNKFSLTGLRLVDVAASMDNMRFTPGMDTLFFVAGDLKTGKNYKYRVSFLKGLAAAYPGGHPVTIVNRPCIGNVSGWLIKTTVSGLGGVFSKVDKASTIFIGAVAREFTT
jgi:hypothetical protein